MQSKWAYHWDVRDDGLHVWDDGVKVALIHPENFKHLVAELAEHLRWQETEKTKAP